MREFPRRFLPVVLVVCLAGDAWAQFTKEYTPWPVVVDGDTLALPFWGGVNSPKPSLVDFNGDGLIDLMIGESRGKVSYLRNTGTTAAPAWTPIAERIGGVNTRTWHRFCDIDDDGDLDLFCDAGNLMTAFYRNESVGPDIVFTLIKDNFGAFETGSNNTPAFVNLRAGDDPDFFLGGLSGRLFWYPEITGDVICEIDTFDVLPADTTDDTTCVEPCPANTVPDSIYIYDTGAVLTCPYFLADPAYDSVFAFPGGLKTADSDKDPQHGFSAITFADYDVDGDYDLFWGDINNNGVYLFRNFGTPAQSNLIEVSESFLPISTFGLNHTAFADLDGDGDVDVIVGAANGNDINNLLLLRNIGTATVPNYAVEDSNLIHDIDLASYAIPALGDLDGDGDQDLLIGGSSGRLSHYQNVGTATAPSFVLTSDFYKSIDVGLSASPWLVDWNADGDLDLLIGNEAGRIQYWRNDGSATNFAPVLASSQLGGIQVDAFANPRPIDWDEDGLIDLVVGEWDFNGFANVLLYENIGTPGSPSLVLVTNRLLKRVPGNFTNPTVYDWDCDGKKDLIVGGIGFGSALYRNTATTGTFPDSLTLTLQPDSLPWSDDGYRLSVAFADMDGDLLRDAFVGEEDGGINFYRREASSCNCSLHGDPNGDGLPTILDVAITVNIAFRNFSNMADAECCPHTSRVDHNCDCQVDILDVATIVNSAFRNGPPPCDPCLNGNQCPR